jgi:hypothetical protein
MSTNLITNKTLAATYEYDANAIQVGGGWTSPTFTVTLVNGTNPPAQGAEVSINYLITSSNLPLTSSGLIAGSIRQNVVVDGNSGSTTIKTINPYNSNLFDFESNTNLNLTGNYLYIWISHDNLYNPVTLSVVGSSTSNGSSFIYSNTTTGLSYNLQCVNNPPQLAWVVSN